MSTSVDERIEDLHAATKAAKAVRRKYPDAMWIQDDGIEYYRVPESTPDTLDCFVRSDRAYIFACDHVRSGHAVSIVRRDNCAEPVEYVLDRLREKHPDAYADLVRWIEGEDP